MRRIEDTAVRSECELAEVWDDLMGLWGFDTQTLWTILVKGDGHVHPVIVPIHDIPEYPDEGVEAIRLVFGQVLDGLDGSTAAFLIARPGPAHFTDADLAWARALIAHDDARLTRWPVHLATQGRVRVFAADDLMRSA